MTNSKNFTESSVLYIVGTPIGNMSDMSPRAVTILQNCDLILAEDTRHSIYLLQKFNINTKLKSYHQHNEAKRTHEIIDLMKKSQEKIALISDAGMPVISDPGYILVKQALENNIKVSVVPGPCAVTSAISISGIDCHQYSFYGFLSSKSKQRYDQLMGLMLDAKSSVIYESPHRLIECLEDISKIDNRLISVIKELTKQYEAVYYGPVDTILNDLREIEKSSKIKGEYVVVISGNNKTKTDSSENPEIEKQLIDALELFKLEGVSLKSAAKILSKLYDKNKNYIYKLGLD